MDKPTRAVVVDDHDTVRAGICAILDRMPDVDVVGEASDGIEALELVDALNPDLLLLDVEMPKMNGRQVANKIREKEMPVQILALSAYDDNQYILGMLDCGVAGYLTKDEVPELLSKAVRGVARGEEGWVSNRVATRIASWRDFDGYDRKTLTNLEIQILRLMAAKSNEMEIATALGIDVQQVGQHIEMLCDKFQVGSRVELIVRAESDGIV